MSKAVPRKRLFLQLLQTGPQTLRAFSSTVFDGTTLPMKPCRCLQVLEQMMEDGTVSTTGGGMFAITELGREDLGTAPAPPVPLVRSQTGIVPPRTFGNHSSSESYQPPTWTSARAAADQNKQFLSRGR